MLPSAGGIRLLPSPKSTPMFLSLQLSNSKQLIQGVALNGQPLQRTDYGHWVIDTPGRRIPLRPPYELVLAGPQGQRLTARQASLRPQTLPVNFEG